MATAKHPVFSFDAPQQKQVEDVDSEAFGLSDHPAFKLLAFWHSQQVLGIGEVQHHA